MIISINSMPSSQYDLNRLKRVYSFLRRSERLIQNESVELTAEIGEVTFLGTDSETHNFTTTFSSAPYVTATSTDLFMNDEANVNITVESVSTTAVTFGASVAFSGSVHFHAIESV